MLLLLLLYVHELVLALVEGLLEGLQEYSLRRGSPALSWACLLFLLLESLQRRRGVHKRLLHARREGSRSSELGLEDGCQRTSLASNA